MPVSFLLLDDPAGFLNGDWRDLLQVAGIAVAAVGFAGAAYSAFRAASAATSAQKAIVKNLSLMDVGSAAGLIGEIASYVDRGEELAGRLKLKDLRELLVQIRESGSYDLGTDSTFQEHLTRLTFIDEEFITKRQDGGYSMDGKAMHAHLRELSDFLNSISARMRVSTGG